jgi:hypothetical protein
LFFADIEGLIYQLSPEDHCGGSGATGSLCQAVEPAPDSGLFRTIDLNHFTNFLANNGRANQFYTRIFGKSYQASSNMEADMDAAENAHMNGTTDIRTENKQ